MSESVIQIDEQAEIQKIIRQLNTLPNQLKAPGVLASAINATANEMKRKIGQRTRKRYAISDKKILTDRKQGGMYLERATGTSTEATLISMGGMVEVMAYMTRRNTETTAAMLKVLNESSFVGLGEKRGPKAFVATFESGHTAIVQRVSGEFYTRGKIWPQSRYDQDKKAHGPGGAHAVWQDLRGGHPGLLFYPAKAHPARGGAGAGRFRESGIKKRPPCRGPQGKSQTLKRWGQAGSGHRKW